MKRAAAIVMVVAMAGLAQSLPTAARVVAPAKTEAPAPAKLNRASIEAIEKATDTKIEATMEEDRFSILGATRGVYLEGYGVVFATEIDLAPSAAPNPFRPAYDRNELSMLREKKKHRIAQLKESMRALLYQAASTLDVRTDDHIAFAVTVQYFRWENSEGMPRQIVLTSTRKNALEAKTGSPVALAAVKVQEWN